MTLTELFKDMVRPTRERVSLVAQAGLLPILVLTEGIAELHRRRIGSVTRPGPVVLSDQIGIEKNRVFHCPHYPPGGQTQSSMGTATRTTSTVSGRPIRQ